MNGPAAVRWEQMRAAAPEAARLAMLLSLAVRIEPPLLRAVRVAAGLGVAAESDLWLSPVVAVAGPRAICLDPAVSDLLRAELASRPAERSMAWQLVRRHHRDSAWSFRLEEQINYLSTYGDDRLDEIEELLAAALAELRRMSERDHAAAAGIARWLLAALARLPEIARTSPAAAVATVAAGVHLDGRLRDVDDLGPDEDNWLAWLLEFVPTVEIWVQRWADGIRFGIDEADRAVPISVPATYPLTVNVIAGDVTVPVRLYSAEPVVIPAPPGPFEVRTVNGRRFRLAADDGPAGPAAFFVNREREMAEFRRLLEETSTPRVVLVTGEAGVGKTTLLMLFREICRELGYEVVMTALREGRTGVADVGDLLGHLGRELAALDLRLPRYNREGGVTALSRDEGWNRLSAALARDLAEHLNMPGNAPIAIFVDDLDIGHPVDELLSALDRIAQQARADSPVVDQTRATAPLVIVAAGRPGVFGAALGPGSSRPADLAIALEPDLDDAAIVEILRRRGVDGPAAELIVREMSERPGARTPREVLQMADALGRLGGPSAESPPA